MDFWALRGSMSVEHRGGGEPTPSEAKRPEQNQPTFEVGEGRHGVPPPQGEQAKPQQESTEGQGGPADLNVSSVNTVDAESPEAGQKDKSPRKLRRWRSSSVGGGKLHGYGKDEIRQNPPSSTDHQKE
jgi:hypothetical protein